MTHLTTKTILKHRVQFYVTSSGQFYGLVINEDGSESHITEYCDTLRQAERAARMELKKEQIRVAVPFTTTDLKPAIARGRHARNRSQILIWIDDGTEKGINATRSSYYSRVVLKPDIPSKDIRALQKLIAARDRARALMTNIQGKISQWEADHSFNLAEAVDKAIADAQFRSAVRNTVQED